MQRLKRICNKG